MRTLIQKMDQVHGDESAFDQGGDVAARLNVLGRNSELKLQLVGLGEYATVWRPIPESLRETRVFYPDYMMTRLHSVVIRIPRRSKVYQSENQFDKTTEELMHSAMAAEGGFGPDVLLAVCDVSQVDASVSPPVSKLVVYTIVEHLRKTYSSSCFPTMTCPQGQPSRRPSSVMTLGTIFDISVRRMFHLDLNMKNFMISCPRIDEQRELMRESLNLRELTKLPSSPPLGLEETIKRMFINVASRTEQVLAIDLDPFFVRRLTPDAAELTKPGDTGRTLTTLVCFSGTTSSLDAF